MNSQRTEIAFVFDCSGSMHLVTAPAPADLHKTLWKINAEEDLVERGGK